MRRRLVWIQGAAEESPLLLKIFLSSTDTSVTISNGVALQTVNVPPNYGYYDFSIAATGANPNDWSIFLYVDDGNASAVGFVTSDGLTASYPSAPVARGVRVGPHFCSATSVDPFEFEWFSLLGSAKTSNYDSSYGYVLPGVLSGNRLRLVSSPTSYESLKTSVIVGHNYSHSLFRGDRPVSGSEFTSGPPWICDAAGNFWRASSLLSNTMFNSPNSMLGLAWPYLYRNTSFTAADIFLGGTPGLRQVNVWRFNLETEVQDSVIAQAYDPGGIVGSSSAPLASVA